MVINKRKICVVTTSRADYGLLYYLIKEIDDDHELELQLVVAGMHLAPEFGCTCDQIKKDGFEIKDKVEFLVSSDSDIGVAKSAGLALLSFTESFSRLYADIIVLLGDRYETLSAATAAHILRIPIAHIHGGELTLGAMDDCFRHAITKLSQVHFPVTERCRERVIKMGEQPSLVHNVGAPGLDHIKHTTLLSRRQLKEKYNISFADKVFVCTYHPETSLGKVFYNGLLNLLSVLNEFKNTTIVFTLSNSDEAGRAFSEKIKEFTREDELYRHSFAALGSVDYMSLIKQSDIVIGNSSSGLIEVPYLKKPSVNIGCRQKGRETASSVLCCGTSKEGIITAINQALSFEFLEKANNVSSPYGEGDASIKIKEVLKSMSIDGILTKKFYESRCEQSICYS